MNFLYSDTATDICGNQLGYNIGEGIGGYAGGLITKVGYFVAPGTSSYFITDYISCMAADGILVAQPNNDTIINSLDSLYCVTTLTAGFTELPGGYHIKTFPNPAIDEINVVYNDLPSEHRYFYTAFDLVGKLVLQQEVQPAGATIFCGQLTPSLYLWQITDERGVKLTSGKLVKE